jgi:hypothetical protein
MAVRAETLRRRRHLLLSLMLGMAFDAAARRQVERLLEGELDPPPAAEIGPGPSQPERVGMVVDSFVAGLAGGVADRLERLDVAGGAIVLERGMGPGQAAGRPELVGVEFGEGLRTLLAVVIGLDRPCQPDRQDEEREQPGQNPLAREHRRQGEQPLGALVELRLALGGPLDGDRNLVGAGRGRHEAKRVGADQDIAAGRELDRAGRRLAAVKLDRKAGLHRDVQAPRNPLDDGVAKGHGEVGQVDIGGWIAADDEPVALDAPGAHDLAPFGAVRDCAEQEGHLPATSRRTR